MWQVVPSVCQMQIYLCVAITTRIRSDGLAVSLPLTGEEEPIDQATISGGIFRAMAAVERGDTYELNVVNLKHGRLTARPSSSVQHPRVRTQ